MVATERSGWVTGRVEASGQRSAFGRAATLQAYAYCDRLYQREMLQDDSIALGYFRCMPIHVQLGGLGAFDVELITGRP
jgi:hypothetical protein